MTREELAIEIENIIADDYIEGVSSIMELIDSQINSQINWEQRRYEIAKSAMNGILSNENQVDFARSEVTYKEHEKHTMPRTIARYAVSCADQLINELKKENHE